MAGLFDTFTIAKRGLFVQQSALNTTSHNIANANTEGYSRQRSVVETTRPFGGMSRFDTCTVGQVGTGAQVTSIQRIRDSFIDYQVRSETGTSGYYTTKSDTLSKVEDIVGEPSDSGIQELMNQFFSAFQEVSKTPDKSDVKTVAIQKAASLADALNYTYNQLEQTCQDNQKTLQNNVTDVNSYLDQVNELNKQIRSVSALGETPNDLMDKRDNLLDKLSNEFGIKIDKDKFETINLASTEYPNSYLVKSSPTDTDYTRLSYVKNATQVLDATGNPTGEVLVEYYPLGNENANVRSFTINTGSAGDTAADLAKKSQDLVNNLKQDRVLIGDKDGLVGTDATTVTATLPTDIAGETVAADGTVTTVKIEGGSTITTVVTPPGSVAQLNTKVFMTYKYDAASGNNVDNKHVRGEIAGNQAVQETIKGYMDDLDRLAASLAYSVNAIQTGSVVDGSTSQGLKNNLVFVTYDEKNKVNTTSDTHITAKTLRVNTDLINDPSKLNCNTTSSSGTGDGARAKAIANLNVVKMNLSSIGSGDVAGMDRSTFLKAIGINITATTTGFQDSNCMQLDAGTEGSTVDSFYKTTVNNLAVANQEAGRLAGNQDTILANLNEQKASVSGVSLDEETTNLIQFQHAYQANAKMISTIDELLDVVINGLKR